MWQVFISLRYLFSKSKNRFISLISLFSVMGIAVGVSALIIVLSIMTGFDHEIKDKIIGTYSHIVILGDGGMDDPDKIIAIAKENKEIISASPFIEEQALIKTQDIVVGVLLRGIDAKRETQTTKINAFTGSGKFEIDDKSIIVGSELLKRLGLLNGDTISIISPVTKKTMDLVITDTFNSGRYDYDANIICVSLDNAKIIFKTDAVTGVGLKVKDEYNVAKTRKELQQALGYPFAVRSWMDIDKNLMKALAMEKKMMFIVLGLIVLVACFNIISTLIMLVMEKTKDIGIMKTLGATSFSIALIFFIQAFLIGFMGTMLGMFAGIKVSENINEIASFIERTFSIEIFPSDIYYFSKIPVVINMSDVTHIIGFALLFALISGIYPAIRASRLDPVEAIRYE